MEGNEEISYWEFTRCFKSEDAMVLLSAKELRRYTFNMYNSISGTAEVVMETLNNPLSATGEAVHKLDLMKKRRRPKYIKSLTTKCS